MSAAAAVELAGRGGGASDVGASASALASFFPEGCACESIGESEAASVSPEMIVDVRLVISSQLTTTEEAIYPNEQCD